MPDLRYATDEQIAKELERRKRMEQSPRPAMVETPNFNQLRSVCRSYIEELDRTGYANDDLKHYIFEAALVALYGNDVWRWIKQKGGEPS